MEETLDSVEKGEKAWKQVLSDFYGPFKESLDNAEKALEGERIKIPAEETDEICEVCGRKMVIKSGRFGRFLACPGYPECTFTKPLVIEMPGKCPKCGSRILKRTSKNGYVYYACERGGRMRIYDLGRSSGGRMSRVRAYDVQEVRPRVQKALLYK